MTTPRQTTTGATVRAEVDGDAAAVFELNARAFGTETEARLVEELRRARRSVISLVATVGDRIVGHILFSPVRVEPSSAGKRVLGLGPMAVQPSAFARGHRLQSRHGVHRIR